MWTRATIFSFKNSTPQGQLTKSLYFPPDWQNNILCHDLAGFGTIWRDLAGFGGLVNPALGVVIALADEVFAEGGGKRGIAAKRRKRRQNIRTFAFFALFRG